MVEQWPGSSIPQSLRERGVAGTQGFTVWQPCLCAEVSPFFRHPFRQWVGKPVASLRRRRTANLFDDLQSVAFAADTLRSGPVIPGRYKLL